MDPEQLLLQLGLAGAILFVVYKLGMKGLDKWSEREAEKNAAIVEGFATVTTSVTRLTETDAASHARLAESHGELRDVVVRMDSKLDTIADLTPVKPHRRQTPAEGVQTGYYAPNRPKTQGGGR